MELKNITSQMFEPEIFNDMCEWYLDTTSGEWKYVVFVVRRSYILAQILEKITQKYMAKVAGTIYLTDAALLLCCDAFADYYRKNGRFPKILLCDDFFIHGRNINHILEGIEKRLMKLLPELNESVLKREFSRATSVRVLVRTDAGSYLINRYNANFSYKRYEISKRWHKLSSDFSTLIENSDIANAAYIYSQHLNKDIVEERILASGDFVETFYQGKKEYIKVCLSGSNIKCVPTIRLISNDETGGYRAVPFVFFANLDAEVTDRLYGIICYKIVERYRGYKKYLSFLDFLYNIDGKRSFNEIFTFIMSNTLLKELNEKYDINPDFSSNKIRAEIDKLARNYCRGDMDEARDIISTFVKEPLFDSVEELMVCFDKLVPKRNSFIKCRNFSDNVSEKKIRQRLEDEFYKSGWDEEREACLFFRNPIFSRENRFQRKTKECAVVIGQMIDELELGYTNIKKLFGYFMQMMDTGVLAISSNPGQNCVVSGLSQFVKTGELALLILELRYYKYLWMLDEVDEFCEQYGVDAEYILEKIIMNNPESFIKSNSERITAAELADVLKKLHDIDQRPKDWLSNYVSRLDVSKSDNIMEQIGAVLKYLDERDTIEERAKWVLNSMII